MKISSIVPLSLAAFMAACSPVSNANFGDRGTPESLLDVSSEIVTVELISRSSVDEIVEWIDTDQPSRAELHCIDGDPLCDEVEQTFALYNIDYEWLSSDFSEAHLMYERVIAHDCENRYVDNRINPYNMNHPSFGCSVASNMVQMVSDRRQFINPDLLGYYDGQSAVKGVTSFRDFDSSRYFNSENDIASIDFSGSS